MNFRIVPSKRGITVSLIVIVYSLCYIGIKSALPYIPPLLFAALRLFAGGFALLVVLWSTNSQIIPKRSNWRWIMVLALLSSALGSAVMFYAADMSSVGIASVLGNLQPLLTVIMALVFLKEPLTASKSTVLILGSIGIILISLPSLRSPITTETTGAVLAFGSSALVASTNIIVKRYLDRKELLRMVVWQLLIGSGILFIVSSIIESWSGIVFNGTLLIVLILLGVIGTGLVNYAWYSVIGWEEVGKVTMYFFLVPVIGFLSGILFYNESFQLIQLIGTAAIIFATIYLAHSKPTATTS